MSIKVLHAFPIAVRFVIFALCLLTLPTTGEYSANAQNARTVTPQSQPRRPLPKPPKGARGFEQYAGRDASTRLIGMGATRGSGVPRKPVAPLEGIALDARPFFLWEPASQTAAYAFTLYDGDIYSDPKAPIVFETETKQPQLAYPATAPTLVKGKLYSWRVGASPAAIRDGSSGSVTTGAPVSFFVLTDEDAAPVTAALSQVAAQNTVAGRLARARVLSEHGVWYDALRMTRELVAENPKDASVMNFYNSLITSLD